MICPGWPPWCGTTRLRAKALGIQIKKRHNIARSWGGCSATLILPILYWRSHQSFCLRMKTFQEASLEVLFLCILSVCNQIQRTYKPRLLPIPIILLLLLLPQVFIPCMLWQVVGIPRRKALGPTFQGHSAHRRQTDAQTWPKC